MAKSNGAWIFWLSVLCCTTMFVDDSYGHGSQKPSLPKESPRNATVKPPKPWAHKVFDNLEQSLRTSARTFLHGDAEHPITFPLPVDVVLVGFDGSGGFGYDLDEVDFYTFLERSFPTHRPACLETHSELEMEVKITYSVRKIRSPNYIREVEEVLRRSLHPVEGKSGIYEMEATKLEPLLQSFYHNAFAGDESAPLNPNVLMIINPDKRRIIEKHDHWLPPPAVEDLTLEDIEKLDGGFTYRYMYEGGGRSATWVSRHRFAVVDISAGPCVFGRTGASEGAVGPGAVPRLAPLLSSYITPPPPPKHGNLSSSEPVHPGKLHKARAKHVTGALSTLVVSAVKHLFAPDIRMETIDHSPRVLIPIIVLANHHAFNPLQPGHAHSLDMKKIKEAAIALTVPWKGKKDSDASSDMNLDEEIEHPVVISGFHSLHEHERLALALTRAKRSHSQAAHAGDGKYTLHTSHKIHSQALLDEFHNAADMLASGLVGLHDPKWARLFYNPNIPAETRREAGKGTRVIPVYVLSLAGEPEGLLMDDDSLVAADRDLVIALQLVTNATSVGDESAARPLKYLSEGEVVTIRPQDTTRHVVAGLAQSLGGVAAPTERYSKLHQRTMESYMWAVGAHPFGPFSNTSHLGELFSDIATRNTLLSQLDTSIRVAREALHDLDAFAAKFMERPFGDHISSHQAGNSWLDELYHDPDRVSAPLPHTIVERLEKELSVLENLYVRTGSLMYDHKVDDGDDVAIHTKTSRKKLAESSEIASLLMDESAGFREYVKHELDAHAAALECCQLEHTLPQRSKSYTYGAILVAGIAVYWMVIYFSKPNEASTYYHYGHY